MEGMNFFRRKKVYETVVLKETPAFTANDAAAITTLNGHPGWVALLNRLRVQRALVESRLNKTRHKDLREVDVLQVGLGWLSYLEDEFARATKATTVVKPIAADEDTLEQFRKIDAFIERVGSPQD